MPEREHEERGKGNDGLGKKEWRNGKENTGRSTQQEQYYVGEISKQKQGAEYPMFSLWGWE